MKSPAGRPALPSPKFPHNPLLWPHPSHLYRAYHDSLWIKLIFYVLLPTDLCLAPCLAHSPGLWLFHLEALGKNIPLGAALQLAAPVGFFLLLLPKIPL